MNLYDHSILARGWCCRSCALPAATLILWHAFRTIPADVLESAALDGAGPLARMWHIVLPLRFGAIAVAWLVALAVALGDLAASILVLPPGVATISTHLFGLLHFRRGGQAAGMSLALLGLFILVAAAARWLWTRWGGGPKSAYGIIELHERATRTTHSAVIPIAAGGDSPRRCRDGPLAGMRRRGRGHGPSHRSPRRQAARSKAAWKLPPGRGILLLARDGVLWSHYAGRGRRTQPRRRHALPPLSAAGDVAREMKGQLPKGFDVHETTHYLIFHNTSRAYAHWCGALLERLYTAFHTYWTRKGFDLAEPKFPLVAIVFADKRRYPDYTRDEAGNGDNDHRLLQPDHQPHDHVRPDRQRRPGQPAWAAAQINQVLSAAGRLR